MIEKDHEKLCGLFNSINNGNIPHAILIECEDNERSLKVSIEISKLIICRGLEYETDKKIVYKKIDSNIHPDVEFIDCKDKANTIGVADVRNLRKEAYVKPNESRYKIYVIKESDKLTIQAQNALLKTLEEPPENVMFIMLCESTRMLIKTILSRVQVVYLDSYDKNKDDFVYEIVKKFVKSISDKREYEILKATSLIGKDRNILKRVLKQAIEIFKDAILYSVCKDLVKEDKGMIENILYNLGYSNINNILYILDETLNLTESNVNHNLLISCLCSKLRETLL